MYASRGEWRCKYGVPTDALGAEIDGRSVACNKSQCTHTDTRIHKGSENVFLHKVTLWGKPSGSFLTGTCTQAAIKYGETLLLRSDVRLFIETSSGWYTERSLHVPLYYQDIKSAGSNLRILGSYNLHEAAQVRALCYSYTHRQRRRTMLPCRSL